MKDLFFFKYYCGLDKIEGTDTFNAWRDSLSLTIKNSLQPARHGNISKWQGILEKMPVVSDVSVRLNAGAIELVTSFDIEPYRQQLETLLRQLKPWRKGPFNVLGVDIDSEWRSNLKWDRLQSHIESLDDRLVLDVGCGNAYYCWRMAAAGARAVIGIDPMLLYLMQYFSIQHLTCSNKVYVLPCTLEAMPDQLETFDTVFSMGVLYHRKSPIDHLLALKGCLRRGGELVLETLVLDTADQQLLVPKDRYAMMKNVWFIPNCELLQGWLLRCGFRDIKMLDVSQTTPDEQRVTKWSSNVSLQDFLDPDNSNKTVEGYPAPVRAVLKARA